MSSYTPLYALLGVQSLGRDGAGPVAVACGVLIILGAVVMVMFLRAVGRKDTGDYDVITAKSRDADIAAYAVGYLLPFVSVVDDGWRDQVSLGLVFLLLGFIYTRSRLIYVNPILFAMGYQLTEATVVTAGAKTDAAHFALILSDSGEVRTGKNLTAIRVTEDLLIINQKDE